MKYKYSRWQLFSKKLNVPRDVQLKIYNHNLSLKEFISYDLIDKIPYYCLSTNARTIAYWLGEDELKRLKTTDLDLNLVERYAKDINVLINFDDIITIINQKIIPQISNDEKKEYLTDLLENQFQMKNQEIKKFMDDYGEIINILLNNSRYLDNFDIKNFIKNIIEMHDDKDKTRDYFSQYTDEILANRHNLSDPIKLSNDEYKEIFKYSSLEAYLKKIENNNRYTSLLMEELSKLPDNYIFNISIPFSALDNNHVLIFIGTYGLKNIVDFDNECGHFFTKNNCKMLKSMFGMYLSNAGNERDPKKDIYVKENFRDENGNYVARPYNKDDFYEAMKRMIIYGPSNPIYKAPDYRSITGEFRVRNAELFISEQASEALQKLFYTKSITSHLLLEHPEYIQFLNGKDLSLCFKNVEIQVEDSNGIGHYEDFYKFLGNKTDSNGVMNFITEYSDVLDTVFNRRIDYINKIKFSVNDDIDQIKNIIHETLRKFIIEKRLTYPKHIPKDLIEKYPSMFLDKNAPQELQEAFYNRTISSEFILSNPSYREYLKNVDLEVLFNYMPVNIVDGEHRYKQVNLVSVIKNIFENEEALDVMLLYNKYIKSIYQLNNLINFKINSNATKEDLLNELDLTIYQTIINDDLRYDDSIPTHFKNKYPSLFLDKDAPQELQEAFYNRTISSEFILSNPSYREYLKNVDLEVLFKCIFLNKVYVDGEYRYERVNLVSVIKNIFENEEALDVMLLYNKYIKSIYQLNNLINFKINSNATKEDLLNELDRNIYQAIISDGLRYDDSISTHFKNKYPSLFLDKDAPQELQEAFYNRTITLNDFNSNPNLSEMFNNINFFIAINEPKMIGKISKHLFFELINNYGYGFLEELKNNIYFNQINKILTSQKELANEIWKSAWESAKEYISLNTILILKKLNFENEIFHKLELKFETMCKVRPEFTENCPGFNIKLLDDDIIKEFGYDFISELLNYNSGATDVFLNQCNKDNIKKWIEYFKSQNMYDDKILHYMILHHTSIYYLVENLIQNNQNLSENDIIILKEIVKNNNEYDIQTIDDLNNYLEIKKKKLDDDVKSDDIEKVKNAVLKILYDIDLTGLRHIINEFGLNSDFFVTQILAKKDILTPEMIAAIETSKEIINENDIDKLQKYAKVGKIEYINFYEIENKLKLFYGNKLNISLTKEFTNNIQNIDGTLIVNYEGEDFKFLIHRLYTYDPKFSDFASQIIQDPSKWNTLDGATTLSTSMISNNHLERVSTKGSLPQVYYGFSEINDDDLMFMGRCDIFVSHGGWQLEPTSRWNEYMDFNTLQYLSRSYNEVALQRKKQSGENKGKKIQPNCIICFNGIINEESIRAAKYFNIPICNIDEDKYINREQINNIDSMLYKKSDTFINNLQQVIQYYNQEEMESLNSENLNSISEYLLDCLAFYTTHEDIDKNQMKKLINEINNLKNKKQNNMEEGIQYEGKSR